MSKIKCTALDGSIKHIDSDELTIRPAVYGIIVQNKKILLMTMMANGKYHLPGGNISKGETIEDALQREIKEETGIEIDKIRFDHFEELFYYYDPSQSANHGLHFFYVCEPISIDLVADKLVKDSSTEKPRWIKIDTLTSCDFVIHGESILKICYETVMLPTQPMSTEYTYQRMKTLSERQMVELAVTMACDDEEYRYEEFLAWIREDFQKINHSRKAYIMALAFGRIVGFIRVWNSPHNHKWMNDGIVVLPGHRNKGVGHQLVCEAMNLAESMGAPSMYFHTWKDNYASIRIHEKAGFHRVTDTFKNSYGGLRNGTSWEYVKEIEGNLRSATQRHG